MEIDHWYSCKKIGSGGYGNVYSIDRLNVVVKIVPLNQLSVVELDTMSRLRHSNIVQALDFGIFRMSNENKLISKVKLISSIMDSVNFGFVMEKADNTLKKFKYESKEQVLNVVEQLKNGLHYLHENKIIHADMKPENILVYFINGIINVKIADFGLSKYTENLKTKDTLVNTIGYRPPEIVNKTAKEIDNSVDYWALGNIIYHMVTGLNTYYTNRGNIDDYFGNKSQDFIDAKIYETFTNLGYPELIAFVQKCLTIKYTNIRIPPEKCDKNDIGYNISIYKNVKIPDYDIKSMISDLLLIDSKLGYDIILKILQFYISNYDNTEDFIHLSELIIDLYINIIDMKSFNAARYYIKLHNKLESCNGIINNYSLYDTTYRNIEKIESLDDYEFIFKHFLKI